MSLLNKAVRGAAWTIGASVTTRGVGLVGTLVLTRFLAPDVMGEVAAASIAVMTANQLSIIGFGQYIIAKPDAGPSAVFHATVFNLLFAVLALTGVLVAMRPLGALVGAPDMVQYIPGLVLAAFIQRLGFMPARVLARDMRFRTASIGNGAGEVAYAGVSVALAAFGLGGDSVVWGNIARAVASTGIFFAAVSWREWFRPCRLRLEEAARMFRFGVPISLAAVLGFMSRRWDNLVFSAMFGPAQMGLYNLAYNLADIPASHIGEHIGDVLLPSFARLPAHRRHSGLVRSTALLALIVFPLAVGLGAIAPTLVELLFTAEWQGIAPLLIVLSVLGVARPIGWTVSAYLQALDRPRWVLILELGKVIALLVGIVAFAALGPVWAAAGVGAAFVVHSVACLWVVQRMERLPSWELVAPMLGPLAASIAMVGAVLAVRWIALGAGAPLGVTLAAEIAIGAVTYVGVGLVVMPQRARDLYSLLRRAAAPDEEQPASEEARAA